MNMIDTGGADGNGDRRLAVPMAGGALAMPGVFSEAAPSTEPPANDLSIGTLLRVIMEWRWLILAILAVGIAAAILVTLLTTPTYRSTAVIELNTPEVEVMGEKMDRGASRISDQQFMGTQLGLLRSRALAERVVQDLNLASNAVLVGSDAPRAAREQTAIGLVQGALDIVPTAQSRLISIHAEVTDPALAARIANGTAESYINSTLERRYQSSSYARDFLQRQIATVRRDLENSERQLVAYAQQQRLITTGSSTQGDSDAGSLTGDRLVSLNSALAAAQARRFAAEQRYREAQGGGPTTEVNERTVTLRQQVAALNAEYQQKLTTFRPDYPDMVRLRAQIETLNGAIATEASAARAGRAGSLRQEYAAAQAEENKLQQQVNALSTEVLDLRGRNIRYTILRRDVDTNRQLYDGLLQRYKEIGVAGGIGSSSATIVDRARVPGGPFRPNAMLNLLIGALAGLLLGIATALALEFINDTIKTPDDVRNKLKLAFLGGIPVSKGAPVDDLADPTSGVSEAYFSVASSLQYTGEGGLPKTLLVTSTRAAEGKSTSALALATRFTRLGKTVLLIDGDMRRPAFVSNNPDEVGLSKLLTNTADLAGSIIQTQVPNLWLVPAGPLPPNPAELLASPRMRAVLEEAGAEFDVVVIDGPPVLGLADAPVISTVVQATLLVIEAGKTRTRSAVEANNRLRGASAHVLGAMLTRYKAQAAYGYGYGYRASDSYSYRIDDKDKKRRRIAIAHDAEA